jgi:hypothetical protein
MTLEKGAMYKVNNNIVVFLYIGYLGLQHYIKQKEYNQVGASSPEMNKLRQTWAD